MKASILSPSISIVFVLCFTAAVSPAAAGTITDDFNDNTTDTSFWKPFVNYDSPPGIGVSVAEANQQLQITVLRDHTTGFYAGYESVNPLVGDFDMQVDYYHLNARPPGYPYWFGTRMGMSFGWGVNQWANVHFVEYWDTPQVMFGAKNGDYSASGSSANGNYDHGRLRFVRTGDRLEGFAWDWVGSNWASIGWGQSAVFADPVKFNLMVWDGGIGTIWNEPPSEASTAFDNFQVTGPYIDPDWTLQMAVVNAGNNAVEYGSWDPAGTFSGFSPIGGSSAETPAMAVFKEREYMAVKGATNNAIYLRYQDYTGNWGAWGTLSGGTNKSPALAAFNNRLYLAVKGATNSNLYLRSMDASENWDASWTTLSGQTTEAPALAVFNNRLFLFVKGASNNNIYYRSMDTSGTWDTNWSVLPGGTTRPIGLSAFNSRLYAFVKGATNSNIYYRSMDTSGVWDSSWTVLSGQTTEGPSVTAFWDKIYAAVRGATSNNAYVRSMGLSGSWDPAWTAVPANAGKAPVLSSFYYNP